MLSVIHSLCWCEGWAWGVCLSLWCVPICKQRHRASGTRLSSTWTTWWTVTGLEGPLVESCWGRKEKQSWENNLLLLETWLFSIIIFLFGRITTDSQKLTVVSTCSEILLVGLLAKIYSTSYYHGQRLKFFRLLPVFKPRYITNMLPTRFKYYKNQLVNLNVYSANTCETIP